MENDATKSKEITDYFRSNIFNAYSAYIGWKVIFGSKCIGIVSKEMANRYVEIQRYHNIFFRTTESAFLVQFTMLSLHAFDYSKSAFSLYKVDSKKTKRFIKTNKKTLDTLRILRNKLFAHRDPMPYGIEDTHYRIPSINTLDQFFKNLIGFYNELTRVVDGSTTIFPNAEEIKWDLENLFMNLYRGEYMRKQNIEMWSWKNGNGRIADVV